MSRRRGFAPRRIATTALLAVAVSWSCGVLAQPRDAGADPPTARFPSTEPPAAPPPETPPDEAPTTRTASPPTAAPGAPHDPAPTAATAPPSAGDPEKERTEAGFGEPPGYYFAGALGLTWFRADSTASNGQERAFRGGAVSVDVAVGGRLDEHSWAFFYFRDWVLAASATDGSGNERNIDDATFRTTMLGVQLLLRPLADERWRLRLGTGLTELDVGYEDPPGSGGSVANVDDDPSGWGWLVGFGWDTRLARAARIGVELRTLYSELGLTEGGQIAVDVTVLQPSLMLTLSTR